MLESKEFLDVKEVFQPVVIDFETLDGEFALEGHWLELSNFIVVYI